MTAFAVFNPASDGGRTGRNWTRIEDALGSIFPHLDAVPAREPSQAAHLVRAALHEGHLDIVAVGGDGIINEALNGFFDHGIIVSREAVFSFVNTNGEIARGFSAQRGPAGAIAHLRQTRIRKADVGKVSCLSHHGTPVTRYFLSQASFGLTGAIARRLGQAHVTQLLGHRFARRLCTLIQALAWHDCRVRLMAPDMQGHGACGYDEIAGIASVILANDHRFGAHTNGKPRTFLHDGLFDVAVMAGGGSRRILHDLARIRAGEYLADPGPRILRTMRLTAAPTVDTDGPVEVETDGQSAGVLPATFEVLPGAINIRL